MFFTYYYENLLLHITVIFSKKKYVKLIQGYVHCARVSKVCNSKESEKNIFSKLLFDYVLLYFF